MGASHPVPDKWEPFQDRFSDSAPEVPPTFPFSYLSNRTLPIQFSIVGCSMLLVGGIALRLGDLTPLLLVSPSLQYPGGR